MTQPAGQPLDLDLIEKRHRAVTSTPKRMDFGQLLGHARTNVPALIAAVRDLRERLDERTATIADKALENASLRAELADRRTENSQLRQAIITAAEHLHDGRDQQAHRLIHHAANTCTTGGTR